MPVRGKSTLHADERASQSIRLGFLRARNNNERPDTRQRRQAFMMAPVPRLGGGPLPADNRLRRSHRGGKNKMKLLITGATGKVGSNLIRGLSARPRPDLVIRALCHNRALPAAPGLEVVKGTISDRDSVERAMDGVSHVVHLATCKEIPELVMDVTVKGLFWLTEAFRASPTAKQFILIGGDASVGHFFYDHGAPVTEATPHRAYPGCYALSKVLEEVLLQQYAYPVRAECLMPARALDHGEGRFPLFALVRR